MTNETNETVGYALWAVFARPETTTATTDAASLPAAIGELASTGVTLRGIYDVSGLRADADVMLWLTGDDAQRLQAALRALRRTSPLASLTPRWNALGVHRDAEFTRDHAPSFMRGLPPKQWVTVYPFVRSLDWYILPEDERRGMLGEHGRMGREFPQVQPNTVAAFALGDYEWILALEADDPIDLVDLMRHLRATEARRHVREEVPFFTGRLIAPDELAEVLS
ncbi:chlorite dismutase [Microbacterium sp. cf046]|uniref:hydrogen peroxide-dependent heme synthase n=1 Tax=Microbacterium sp. cf046 TaxID=1761803 RepID=UPI0008E685A9|nr:hydrogen peroxide-dependent heme synthase [Microbacterium sp. cf046]SFS15698.1 chlorite dismutase [Microbacterium sp. cf046]